MEFRTLNDVLLAAVDRDLARIVRSRDSGTWVHLSTRQFYAQITAVARQLLAWGIQKGDRIAILSENRPEWAITDFAALMIGAVVVPIYATLTAEQASYLLKDSETRTIFVSSAEQMAKAKQLVDIGAITRVVVMDEVANSGAVCFSQIIANASEARDPALEDRARAIQADDLATIIYTSGTSGVPKGAMLTHGNIASNMALSLKAFGFEAGDEVCISFLPLSHVTARHLDYCLFMRGVEIAYCPFMDQLATYLMEVRPTLVVGVPRIFEKVREKAESKAGGGLKRRIFDWALQVGGRQMRQTLAGEPHSGIAWKIADKLLFSKVLAGFGGKVRVFISGGAPLGMDLAKWYASVGIRIFEGYGLTETSPVIAINAPQAHRIGSVGRPLANVECTIAADDELLVRGPSVFSGYWKREEDTRNAFTEHNGTPHWFKTGDIARIDDDGFLFITDRKKDLIKTSGGKFIAPQPIESKLKANPFVSEAALLGDKRKFPAVLIAPNFPALEEWARDNEIEFAERKQLVRSAKIRALYESIVHELNRELAHFEQLKKVLIVPDEFSVASGELTPSMKLKRRVVEQKYSAEIEALYSEPRL